MSSKKDFYPMLGVASMFLIFGSAATFGSFLSFRSSYRKIKNWKTDVGTVIDYYAQSGGSQMHYAPRIQFVADDGKQIVFVASTGSNRQSYRIGANVKILYSPNDPEKADLKSFTNLWVLPIFLGLFGLSFLVIGLLAVITVFTGKL
jgi:hypothetical protein